MLTFTKENDMFILGKRRDGQTIATLFINPLSGVVRVTSVSRFDTSSSDLRQIADKLDELNGADDGISQ